MDYQFLFSYRNYNFKYYWLFDFIINNLLILYLTYLFILIWLVIDYMVCNLPVDSDTCVVWLLRRRINILDIVFVVFDSCVYDLIVLVLMLLQFYVQ